MFCISDFFFLKQRLVEDLEYSELCHKVAGEENIVGKEKGGEREEGGGEIDGREGGGENLRRGERKEKRGERGRRD